jgi:hypothetical protein
MNTTTGAGTREDPWVLRTPPGTSEYQMYRDESADPAALVCVVGKTTLSYQLRCLEDLHAMLVGHGDWIALGSADEQKTPARARSRPGVDQRPTPWAASMAPRRGFGDALACTSRR